jgi:hypothetical protein
MLKYKILSVVLIIFSFPSFAQKILSFDFHTLTIGNEVTATSNYNDQNLSTSTITRGPGILFLDANWINVTGGTLDPGLFNSYQWTTSTNIDPDDYLEFTIAPDIGYQFFINSIKIEHERNGAGPTSFVVRTSYDGFTTNIGGVNFVPEVQATPVVRNIEFPQNFVFNSNLTIRLYAFGASSFLGTWGVGIGGATTITRDNIVVNGFVSPITSPSLFTSKNNLSEFTYFLNNGPSNILSFNISGNNLLGDITINGITNYEVSLDSITFYPSLLLSNSGGNLAPTKIFVRLKDSLIVNDYSETLLINSDGAVQNSINCSGFVSPYNLVINEVLSDAYPSGTFDTNNNGISNYVEDQFIELVNAGSTIIDLTGFTIRIYSYSLNSTTIKHTFTNGTLLNPGEAMVVFGGGGLLTNFTTCQAQATLNGLRMNEAGGIVTLRDNTVSNKRVAVYSFGNEGANNQSLARNPDYTGPFFVHSQIVSNPVSISVGRRNSDSTPLPVELSTFSALMFKDRVKLIWQTKTETNNYGFEVERSEKPDVKSEIWEKIGFMDGHGNSNSPKDYTFEDNNVIGINYAYRLKQIDNDGNYNYSKIVEVDLSLPINFELSQNYPNPFNPTTHIKFSVPQMGFVKLIIFNLLGEEVTTLVNENREAGIYTVNFNASELNSGLYIYRIEANGNIDSKKMLLLK